jgi:hypothetical protein
LKFLYKINSRYDGFQPARIPERLEADRELRLAWDRYVESVEEGSEVWVYFKGPHNFEPGIYVRGLVASIDVDGAEVMLGDLKYSTDTPLSDVGDPATTGHIALAVAARGRQVFPLPQEFEPVEDCTIAVPGAESCLERRCRWCATWKALPRIGRGELGSPDRLRAELEAFVPAYWVIAPRTDLWYESWRVRPGIRRTSELFYRFKNGEEALAYPLALGMYESLRKRDLLEFDAIIPIPLSPEKERAKEIHRTLLLANELSLLLRVDVADALELKKSISKRKMRVSAGAFESAYWEALYADSSVSELERVLLVDDVCTNGSTLAVAFDEIVRVGGDCEVVASTAGQMTVRSAVRKPGALLAR